MQEVDDEPLNMRSVGILVRHDHNRAVAQAFQILILLADLQAHDLDDILDLLVLRYLFVRGFADIE